MARSSDSTVSPARIARIPDILINQIAAGEVVERPASALKELMENSLDAGAHRIEVLLQEGGMRELTVVDDGSGIHPEDLLLCLERHATSKIRQSQDLEAIGTYGFRGEALASIASVSQVELQSRTQDAASAVSVCIAYGESQGDPRPVGSPVGTRITVRDLFSRLPARQKFLRSASTEFSHCARVVRELAVGNPHVSFSLHHQGKRVNAYQACTRLGRIQEAFSWNWEPLHVQEQSDGLELDAYLTPGDHTQDRGELLLFINQRPVRNRSLLSAIRQAYASTLGPHHEPSGVVYLTIRPDWVDVNVHPQKTEVRCLRQEGLYSWLLSAIRKAIAVQPSIRAMTAPSPQPPSAPTTPPAVFVPPAKAWTPPARTYQPSLLDVPAASNPQQTALTPEEPKMERAWRYLGQAKAAYLICEDAKGILLVDQHALHEKMRFEELCRQQNSQPLIGQRLLLPKVFRLAADQAALLEENLSELNRLGFEIEAFGDGDWAIKALPENITEEHAESIVTETLREIARQRENAEHVRDRAIRPILATIACHSVVRAGQALSDFEAEALLDGIDDLEQGWTCPHGRPVVFRLGFGEIEKHFERK